MEFKQLFDNERAVSPVIGVILMVAITVILAAVIGTFVLGLGDQVQNTTPTASFDFSQGSESVGDNGTPTFNTLTTMTVTHQSGDTISESDLEIAVDGNLAVGVANLDTPGTDNSTVVPWNSGADVSAGSSGKIYGYYTGSGGASAATGVVIDYSNTWGSSGDFEGLSSGQTVQVLYNSPDSDSSSTLGKREVQ